MAKFCFVHNYKITRLAPECSQYWVREMAGI